jgi:flagellum-specific peptidoglycan hydrolase FlgJ
MNNKSLTLVKTHLQAAWHKMQTNKVKTGIQLSFAAAVLFFLTQREFSFQFNMKATESANAFAAPINEKPVSKPKFQTQEASLIPSSALWWEEIKDNQPTIEEKLNLANPATAVGAALTDAQQKEAAKFSNLGFLLNPGLAKKLGVSDAVVAYKRQKCLDYINTYLAVAQEEMDIFGIPASITLAQGLVESNAGDSRLARNENNHFGIKCKSKCLGCRCANYTDDDQYDMFRIFESPWYSFREHSKLLTGNRYKHLLKLPITDYKNWAHGLQAAGYATNQKYAKTLIDVIEKLELHKYDRPKKK